jgi:hypothetical protein
VKTAVEHLRVVQQQGVERLRMVLPPVTQIEAALDGEAPLPLFTTEDYSVLATLRLINHKKLNDI